MHTQYNILYHYIIKIQIEFPWWWWCWCCYSPVDCSVGLIFAFSIYDTRTQAKWLSTYNSTKRQRMRENNLKRTTLQSAPVTECQEDKLYSLQVATKTNHMWEENPIQSVLVKAHKHFKGLINHTVIRCEQMSFEYVYLHSHEIPNSHLHSGDKLFKK